MAKKSQCDSFWKVRSRHVHIYIYYTEQHKRINNWPGNTLHTWEHSLCCPPHLPGFSSVAFTINGLLSSFPLCNILTLVAGDLKKSNNFWRKVTENKSQKTIKQKLSNSFIDIASVTYNTFSQCCDLSLVPKGKDCTNNITWFINAGLRSEMQLSQICHNYS